MGVENEEIRTDTIIISAMMYGAGLLVAGVLVKVFPQGDVSALFGLAGAAFLVSGVASAKWRWG